MPAPDPTHTSLLRTQLKDWEHAFESAHGRKPTRAEVKANPLISAKYKEYNKLRSSNPPPLPTVPKPQHTPSTAHHDDPFASAKSTASTTRRVDVFKTPTKQGLTPADQHEMYESPLSLRRTRLFGNRPRETVGPTPQKTGKVLGLFESFADVETTPRKVTEPTTATTPGSVQDSGQFSTPRKRKAEEISRKDEEEFKTPSFLRRDSARFASSLLESPPVPLPMRPLGGLSCRVAEIKKMEDEAFNDEEEVMRELENAQEEGAGEPVLPLPLPGRGQEEVGAVALPPGAFVEEGRVDGDEDKDRDTDKPKWKKKGLKRQTKRTIMRPVTKLQEMPDSDPPPDPAAAEQPPAGYNDEEDLSNPESEEEETDPHHNNKKAMVEKGKAVVKKVARKIKATANANFRRLNIRGQNGKAKGSSRFRKRR